MGGRPRGCNLRSESRPDADTHILLLEYSDPFVRCQADLTLGDGIGLESMREFTRS